MCGSSTTVCAAYDYGTPAPIRRQRIKAPWRLRVASPCLALMIALLWSKPTQAQDSVLPDTYGDAGVEALLARARAARTRSVECIESYEGRLRQRVYVGLTGQRFRRERGLFESERIALIRWTGGGDRTIQWEGVRTAIPIAGLDTGDPERRGVRTVVTDSTSSISAGSNRVEIWLGTSSGASICLASTSIRVGTDSDLGVTIGRFIHSPTPR